MKALFKAQLRKLLFNPFTYLLCFLFSLFCILYFFIITRFFTPLGTTDLHRFFSSMPYASILLFPALASFSSINKTSCELPFSSLEIFLAKTLSLFCTFFFLALLPTVVVPVSVTFFGHVEAAPVFCAYLVMCLFALSSFSLCLFLGLLIPHSGAAFLCGALVLAITNSIHLLPISLNLGKTASVLLQNLSFAWHFDSAGKGIIESKDIFFYLILMIFFLLASVTVMEKNRGKIPSFQKKLLHLSFITLSLLLICTNLYSFKTDVSETKQFSVSHFSKEVLKKSEAPVSISYYRSLPLRNLYPQIHDVEDFLLSYASSNKNISLKILDPAKNSSAEKLEALGISGQQMQTASGDVRSYAMVYSALVINYLGDTEIIPFVLDTSNLEYDITSKMESLLLGRERKVQVVVANGMKLSEDYAYVKPWLEAQGFSVQETYIPSQSEGLVKPSFTLFPEVPLIVIGTVRFDYSDAVALMTRIRKGSKTFIATSPFTIDLKNEWQVVEALDDEVIFQLKSFGVYLLSTLTCDISNFPLEMYSDTTSSGLTASPKTEYVNYPLWPVLMPQKNAPNGMTSFWPCSMELFADVAESENRSLKPYLVTSPKAWQLEKTGSTFVTNPFAVPSVPEDSSYSQFSLAVAMGSEGVDNCIVWGDQYSLHSSLIAFTSSQTADLRSLVFLSDSLLDLTGEKELLNLKNKNIVDKSLSKVSAESLSEKALPTVLSCIIMNLLFEFAAFALVGIKRKKWSNI